MLIQQMVLASSVIMVISIYQPYTVETISVTSPSIALINCKINIRNGQRSIPRLFQCRSSGMPKIIIKITMRKILALSCSTKQAAAE